MLWGARLNAGESLTLPDDPHVHVFVALGSGLLAFLAWYFLGNEGFLFALTAAVSTMRKQTYALT